MRRVSDEFDSQGRVTEKFHKARKRICVSRVGYIEEYITTVQTCLDVGAGAGTFAHRLERSHPELDIECLELDPMIVEECQRLGFHTYNKSFFENKFDKTYDVVFLWHVLEHVKDAHAFLSKAVTLADKYVILEVPLLQAMNGTGRIRSLKAPNIGNYDGHAHYFNKQSFIKLVEKIDHLEIIEIREGTQTPALFSALSVK
jgi:ubiquinone/menaquinone biosynthesis C-methylase UbiE|tara:strand:+ start:217 stop:819 length:603 start_codon:yes stop_codon:yes gene_type:complete